MWFDLSSDVFYSCDMFDQSLAEQLYRDKDLLAKDNTHKCSCKFMGEFSS